MNNEGRWADFFAFEKPNGRTPQPLVPSIIQSQEKRAETPGDNHVAGGVNSEPSEDLGAADHDRPPIRLDRQSPDSWSQIDRVTQTDSEGRGNTGAAGDAPIDHASINDATSHRRVKSSLWGWLGRYWPQRSKDVVERNKGEAREQGQPHHSAQPNHAFTFRESAGRNDSTSTRSWIIKLLVLLVAAAMFSFSGREASSGGDHPTKLSSFFEPVVISQIQKDVAYLLSSVRQHPFLTDADQIEDAVQQIRHAVHQYRLLAGNVSLGLGTTVTSHIQEWVHRDNCTPALQSEVQCIASKIQSTLDYADKCTTAVGAALHIAQSAASSDSEYQRKYNREYKWKNYYGRAGASPDQIDQERNAVLASQGTLETLIPRLQSIAQNLKPEHKRMRSLQRDMAVLDRTIRDQVSSARPNAGHLTDHATSWNCHNFDIPVLEDIFTSMLSYMIQDDERLVEFQAIYRDSSIPIERRSSM